MALELTLRRRRRLSMTSLIDVIFLLLLFFMLSSTFSQFGDVELLAGGGAGQGETVPQQIFVSLRSDGLLVNGQSIPLSQLADRLSALRGDGAALALVSLGAEATSQQLIDLLAAVQAVSDVTVVVLE